MLGDAIVKLKIYAVMHSHVNIDSQITHNCVSLQSHA